MPSFRTASRGGPIAEDLDTGFGPVRKSPFRRETLDQRDRIYDDSGNVVEDLHWADLHIRKLMDLGWYPNLVGLWDPSIGLKKAGTGAIATLYDLSGGDNDLTQSTTSKKPTAVQFAGKIFSYDSGLSSKDGTGPKSGSVTTQHSWDGKYGGSVAVDEGSTNEITYSEALNNSPWITTKASVTADATTAPDGNSTADRLVEDGTSDIHGITQEISGLSADETGTISAFVKADTRDWVRVGISDSDNRAEVWVNASNGNVGTKDEAGDTTIENVVVTPVNNSYYRVKFAVTPGSGETLSSAEFWLANADGVESYSGDGSSGLYIWGVQVESGSYPTSYIPTSGSTVTRSAGQLKYDKSILSAEEGTILIDANIRDGEPHSSGKHYLWSIADADGNNELSAFLDGGTVTVQSKDGQGNTTTLTGTSPAQGWLDVAVTWDKSANTLTLYEDGSQQAQSTTANLPDSFDNAQDSALHIGTWTDEGQHWNSRFDELNVETRELTATEVSEAFNADSPASEAIRQVSAYDGSDDFVSIGDNADLSVGDEDFFLCGLVRLDSVGDSARIISKGDPNNSGGEYELHTDGSNQFRFTLRDSDDGGLNAMSATTFGALSVSTWYLVVAYYDAGSDEQALQVNGGTIDTQSNSEGVNDGSNNLEIGHRPGAAFYVNGQLGPVLMGKGYIPSAQEITDYKTFLENAFGLSL